MFSGIVEATSKVKSCSQQGSVVTVIVERPTEFDDLNLGDSVAFNGVCLTVEAWDEDSIQFAIAAETLKVTGWSLESLQQKSVNLERSLRLGDRIHGHMVAGHVDAMGVVLSAEDQAGSWIMQVGYSESLRPMIWKKGSITVNGVSLTVNEVNDDSFSVCLIPETLKRTNLQSFGPGSRVTLEADTMARAVRRYFETRSENVVGREETVVLSEAPVFLSEAKDLKGSSATPQNDDGKMTTLQNED